MPRLPIILALILLIQLLTGCGQSNQSGYQGYLYFANGSYLMQFSLRDGSLSVVSSFGNKTINDVSSFGENRLLLTESELVNRKEVNRISWLDVKTGQRSTLYPGFFARYFAESGLMIYDDGRRLFVVNQAGDLSSEIIFTHKLNQLLTVMAIPGNTVLFETSEVGVRGIYSYHLLTGELNSLDRLAEICRLKYAVWIEDLAQMACKPPPNGESEGDYVMTDLQGVETRRLELPEGKRFDALTYIPGQSALILKERWNSRFSEQEKAAAWIHNIQSGESHRLARNINLGSSVVYTVF